MPAPPPSPPDAPALKDRKNNVIVEAPGFSPGENPQRGSPGL